MNFGSDNMVGRDQFWHHKSFPFCNSMGSKASVHWESFCLYCFCVYQPHVCFNENTCLLLMVVPQELDEVGGAWGQVGSHLLQNFHCSSKFHYLSKFMASLPSFCPTCHCLSEFLEVGPHFVQISYGLLKSIGGIQVQWSNRCNFFTCSTFGTIAD